jgi:hypothetical protein
MHVALAQLLRNLEQVAQAEFIRMAAQRTNH